MMIGNKIVEMNLELDQVRPLVAGLETDSEDFTLNIDLFASEISSEEETYVVDILRDDHIECDFDLREAMDDDLSNLPALLEEDKESDSE